MANILYYLRKHGIKVAYENKPLTSGTIYPTEKMQSAIGTTFNVPEASPTVFDAPYIPRRVVMRPGIRLLRKAPLANDISQAYTTFSTLNNAAKGLGKATDYLANDKYKTQANILNMSLPDNSATITPEQVAAAWGRPKQQTAPAIKGVEKPTGLKRWLKDYSYYSPFF